MGSPQRLLQSDYPLGKLIIQTTRAEVAPDDATYFWTADDRGLSDFVNGAFRLFGPRMKALYYFWFLLLGLSLAAALIRFWNDRIALAAVAFINLISGQKVQKCQKRQEVYIETKRLITI